ncbi:MAG: fluoride efflux transporter CrcB [Bacteroidales bacterium]|nr:fluoride efflux transporter CrcB [Bacteroidales bacterium]
MFRILMIIGTGSFLGGVSRFVVSRMVQSSADSAFPFGTLMVNILGCLIIGIVYGVADRGTIITPEMRLFLAVGFCGGFTTFSAFAAENIALLRDGNVLYFALYAGISVFLGVLATWSGNVLIKLI